MSDLNIKKDHIFLGYYSLGIHTIAEKDGRLCSYGWLFQNMEDLSLNTKEFYINKDQDVHIISKNKHYDANVIKELIHQQIKIQVTGYQY